MLTDSRRHKILLIANAQYHKQWMQGDLRRMGIFHNVEKLLLIDQERLMRANDFSDWIVIAYIDSFRKANWNEWLGIQNQLDRRSTKFVEWKSEDQLVDVRAKLIKTYNL